MLLKIRQRPRTHVVKLSISLQQPMILAVYHRHDCQQDY